MRAEQAFVEEAVGDEAGQAILPEVEGRHRDQRRHEMFERVEPAVVGDMRANFDEPVIDARLRSEEHTSELQSLMRISYAFFGLENTYYSQPNLSFPTANNA